MIKNDHEKSANTASRSTSKSSAPTVNPPACGSTEQSLGQPLDQSRGKGTESPSKLQRYLDRQKNASLAPENLEPSLQNLKPQFGLNSAYFMWAFETFSNQAQVEFRNWQTRRREAKIKTALDHEKAQADAERHAAEVTTSGDLSQVAVGAFDVRHGTAGPIGLAVDPARPLTWIHAEFGVRLLAVIIDWIILAMIRSAIMRVASQSLFGGLFGGLLGQDELYQSSTSGFTQSFYWNILPTNFFLMWTALKIPYYGFFYSQRGASPGKLAMGLQVVDARTGRFLTPWISIFRETIGTMLSWAIFSIGYLMAAFRYDRRAFHDLLFESVVVRVPPKRWIKPPAA